MSENEKTRVNSEAWGGRPISDTLLDFGQPVLSGLSPDSSNQTLQDLVKIVVTVWNCHVMAMPIWGQPQHLKSLVTVVESGLAPEAMKDAYDALTARRADAFGADPRAIGSWEVRIDEGALKFQCDARLPAGVTLEE